MPRYRFSVIWTVDLTASCAAEAARCAREAQLSHVYDKTTFYVTKIRKDTTRTEIIHVIEKEPA